MVERNIQQDPGRAKVYYPWGANRAGVVLETSDQEARVRRIEWVNKTVIVSVPLVLAVAATLPLRSWELPVWVGICAAYALAFLACTAIKRYLIRDLRVSHRFYVKSQQEIREDAANRLENRSTRQLIGLLCLTTIFAAAMFGILATLDRDDWIFEHGLYLGWAVVAIHLLAGAISAYLAARIGHELVRRSWAAKKPRS